MVLERWNLSRLMAGITVNTMVLVWWSNLKHVWCRNTMAFTLNCNNLTQPVCVESGPLYSGTPPEYNGIFIVVISWKHVAHDDFFHHHPVLTVNSAI